MNDIALRAIAGADHMTSREADQHDSDGWYRATIRELLAYIQELKQSVPNDNEAKA